MLRYISIDVALKSLAISIIDYNKNKIDLNDKTLFKNLTVIKTITENLSPNKHNIDIKEIERIELIVNFIKKNVFQYVNEDTIVLIEKQINTTPSYICYITIITLFINNNIKVDTIAPTWKNQLEIDDIKIGKFLKNNMNSYIANKKHSKAIVDAIIPYLTDNNKININKKYETDFSDTISQLIAFILQQKS